MSCNEVEHLDVSLTYVLDKIRKWIEVKRTVDSQSNLIHFNFFFGYGQRGSWHVIDWSVPHDLSSRCRRLLTNMELLLNEICSTGGDTSDQASAQQQDHDQPGRWSGYAGSGR